MRDKERIIIIISILPLFLMTGCISSRTIPEREKVQYYTIPALSNEILDKRIYEIKNLLKENSLSDDRKETAISILKVYEKLKSLNEGALTEKQSRKTIKLLFDTLVKIEQQYFYNGIVSGDAAGQIIIENYSALKKQIYEDYFSGDLKSVISGCGELVSRFGKNGLTPDLGIMLVEALSKNKMTSDALTLARSILGAVENRPDLIRLLADAIELELKAGNTEDARQLYEKLIDGMNERNNLYLNAGNLLSAYQGNGPGVDESVKEKISEIDPEKAVQIQQMVDNVEKLLSQKDFSGARLELVRRRLRAEEGPELDMIEQLWKSVDKAEEQFNSENSYDKIIIEDAKKLIEEEKFEDALEILEPVVAEGGNYEADKVKKDAIERLINREKLIAANLKREANEEINVQRKRDLLLKVKSIFQNLIDKYPTSPLIDRIKRNVSVVEIEP